MSSWADKGRDVPTGENGAAAVGGKPEWRPRYITSLDKSVAYHSSWLLWGYWLRWICHSVNQPYFMLFFKLMTLPIVMCFYFVGAEREERSRSGERGDRQRGSTCQWHSELRGTSLMAFCLSSPHHAGVAAAAPSPPLLSSTPLHSTPLKRFCTQRFVWVVKRHRC